MSTTTIDPRSTASQGTAPCSYSFQPQSKNQFAASELLSTSIGMNSIGVALLESNETEVAKECFKDAIDILAKSTVASSSQVDNVGNNNNGASSSDCLDFLHSYASQVEDRLLIRRRSRPFQSAAPCAVDPIVFARPANVHVAASVPGDDPTSVRSSSRRAAASAVLFNLALAHHLESCMSGGRKESSAKALSLYGMAESMLLKTDEAARAEGHTAAEAAARHGISADLLARAILNNRGHLCLEWGERDVGMECFEALKEATSRACSPGTSGAASGDVRRFDWFEFNVLVTQQMITAPMA